MVKLKQLAIFTFISVFFNACCKFQTEAPLIIQFKNFDFSKMKSVWLIKSDLNNIKQAIDTVFFDLSEEHAIRIPIYDDNESKNYNYTIKNSAPFFKYEITELSVARSKSFGCAGGNIKYSFNCNQVSYEKDFEHTIIIKL